ESLLGHSGCRVGGNDLDIMLAFRQFCPLLGMNGITAKGTALPVLPWWNAVAINDVPAQAEFYSSACGKLLRDLIRDAREPDRVERLLTVWRQRLSYRLVRLAEEQKIALSQAESSQAHLSFISPDLATCVSASQLEEAIAQPLEHIRQQLIQAQKNSQTRPDVIYLTGGSARSPLLRAAISDCLPEVPIASGDDFGSVTAGLARWAETLFR
ncbi:Hsp70 family protein, partial [Dickeya dianthicola]